VMNIDATVFRYTCSSTLTSPLAQRPWGVGLRLNEEWWGWETTTSKCLWGERQCHFTSPLANFLSRLPQLLECKPAMHSTQCETFLFLAPAVEVSLTLAVQYRTCLKDLSLAFPARRPSLLLLWNMQDALRCYCYEILMCPFEWTGTFANEYEYFTTDTSLNGRNYLIIIIYIINVNE
jgi:hypothetical protein